LLFQKVGIEELLRRMEPKQENNLAGQSKSCRSMSGILDIWIHDMSSKKLG
jgi:hypothetical protein